MESPARRRRPTDVLLAVLAAAGLADVVYLGIQEARGFAGGCTGFDPNVIAAPTTGCGAALTSTYSTFLGISNVTLGYAFWGAVLALSLAALFASPGVQARARQLRLWMLGIGVLYAAYLTVILATGRSGGFCPFCFVSHVLTFLSFAAALYAARSSRSV